MAAVVAVAIPLAPAAGQEEQPKIVYGRSAGELDLPEENEVFIMNADGTDPVQLTNNDKEDAFPALSPDGSRIAFSRRVNGQYDLFVMDAAGSNVKPLMRTRNADEVLPSWSPSGGRLAYTATTSTPHGWQSDIYRIRVETGRFRRLTFTPVTKEFAPEWSPDGREIAFTKQNEKRQRFGIAIVRPDATGLRWLVINPDSKSGYTDVNPTWSPDSEWIAFSRDHGDDPFDNIYKVRRDGSQVTPVTELNELSENPVWGADGRIIFMHDQGIAVVGSDGGDIEHITATRTGLPYWWPDW